MFVGHKIYCVDIKIYFTMKKIYFCEINVYLTNILERGELANLIISNEIQNRANGDFKIISNMFKNPACPVFC